jgi:hypothetical protein
MGAIESSQATLRIFGEDLVPEEITAMLGNAPTVSQRKGQEIIGTKTGTVRIAKTRNWRLSALRREPEDLEGQIAELLGKVTSDLVVWESLAHCFEIDLFCGLFMGSSNDGVELSPATLLALGQRGISLSLDIYDPIVEGSSDGP